MDAQPVDQDVRNATVCLVDDDEIMQDLVSRYITRLGYQVLAAHEPQIAVELIKAGTVDVVISDLYMPDMQDGLNFLSTIKKQYPMLAVIVMSSEMSESTQRTLFAAGAFACLSKPVSSSILADVLGTVPVGQSEN